MPEVRIAAEPRTEFGKGAARRERRAGRVPAVLYGHGTDTRHLTLPGHDVMMALKTANVLIRLDGLPGGNQLVLPKSVQRNPIRGSVEHVDLILVRRGEKVTVDIPIQVTGEVYSGGLLDQQMVQIAIEAEATHIPTGIDVNVEDMQVGTAVHAGDLELPDGSSLAVEPDALVLHVIAAPTAEQMEAEIGVPETAAAAPAEPAPVPEGESAAELRCGGRIAWPGPSGCGGRVDRACGAARQARRPGSGKGHGRRRALADRRAGQSRTRLRGQPAQRRLHGGRRDRRPDRRPVPGRVSSGPSSLRAVSTGRRSPWPSR